MAYGKPNNFNGRRINARYTMKEGATFLDVPYFRLSEKLGDKYPDLTPKQLKELTGEETFPTEISGNLTEITTRVNEFEGSPIRSYKLRLEDGDIHNYVEFGLGSSVGRSVANSVLNLQAFDNVQFGSYARFDKAKNKSFANVSVRQGEKTDTVKAKYDYKDPNTELPKAREFEGKGGKTERDYTAQEEFLLAKLNEFAKVVEEAAKKGFKSAPSAPKATASTPPPAAAATAVPQENLDEDVPF